MELCNEALVELAGEGNHQAVRHLLCIQGINVNYEGMNTTPLTGASSKGHAQTVVLLLRAPWIDVNFRDDEGDTALIVASGKGHLRVVCLLLAAPGIDVNLTDGDDQTALRRAASAGHMHVVSMLLTDPGIDINSSDDEGSTALIQASTKGHAPVVSLLLSVNGIKVNIPDVRTKTALMWASLRGHADVVSLLLDAPGIDVNRRDMHQDTALTLSRSHEVVILLLGTAGVTVPSQFDPKNVFEHWDRVIMLEMARRYSIPIVDPPSRRLRSSQTPTEHLRLGVDVVRYTVKNLKAELFVELMETILLS
jgi:ankyrin repeat protein